MDYDPIGLPIDLEFDGDFSDEDGFEDLYRKGQLNDTPYHYRRVCFRNDLFLRLSRPHQRML